MTVNVNNSFRRIQVAGWRQFRAVDIEFHPRLTVITGTNGAGKSTLLNILSEHLGVARPYLGVPTRHRGETRFSSGLFRVPQSIFAWMRSENSYASQNLQRVGDLEYSNQSRAVLTAPISGALQYSLRVDGRQGVVGFHFPSHRMLPNYQEVPSIAFKGVDPANAFQMMLGQSYAGFLGQNTGSTVMFQLKTILASWAAIGEGNSIFDADPKQLTAYRGFIEILKKILPPEIGFRALSIRPPDLVLETNSGEFLIDAASGGLTTLIEISALIYACSLTDAVSGGNFVVTFDEPENHLHPSLQRTLLPILVETFPQVQFIVATHSPFMVSSVQDSRVYVLKYHHSTAKNIEGKIDGRMRIESISLDYVNRAGTAGEILREVLGVPVTFPAWVEDRINVIVEKYRDIPVSVDSIESLRRDVTDGGLEGLFPEVLVKYGEIT